MALLLPSFLPWPAVLCLIAALALGGVVTTIPRRGAQVSAAPSPSSAEDWFKEAVIRPFAEFVAYRGWVVILYSPFSTSTATHWAESMAAAVLRADGLHWSGNLRVTKTFGVASTILGGLAGGVPCRAATAIFKSLFVAGILQAVNQT